MTKAALRALVRVAAAELGRRNIRVNALCPGAIETPLWGKLGLPADVLKAAGEGITAQIPVKRWGKPEEIARAALFLACNDAHVSRAGAVRLGVVDPERLVFNAGAIRPGHLAPSKCLTQEWKSRWRLTRVREIRLRLNTVRPLQ